jgi:hypothetical protein
MEDGVIEHDARLVPGYELIGSDVTGRAVFARGRERLEVFTANRRQLEKAFGVDLIYLNATRQNLVMLQYKMLEPGGGGMNDWVFTPDKQFAEELERMRKFSVSHTSDGSEYRFNTSIFYLKFVKRDGALKQGGFIMPIDHYDKFVLTPAARGPKGGLRIGYNALGGRYMREQPFLDLIKAGYVGAHAETTDQLMALVKGVLDRGRAVVGAIQTATTDAQIGPETSVPEDDDDLDLE